MSCHKCCFYPCDRTAICREGTYWFRDQDGNRQMWIAPSDPLKSIISKAVLEALGIEDAVKQY